MRGYGRDKGIKGLIAINIILVMMVGCFLKCCLHLMPGGDPVISVAVTWACL